ncbi:hypothetical protein GCM10010345_00510 [Streptomyces canarius]|uniref:Uncharacterized protein n=1 Tax=Streptomyces canarius TaxID=285453 RepID=A0ABQ3CER6_9ACTN|nr:hypothetical protein GCM10010345_00510 [Streptomyces canarius]
MRPLRRVRDQRPGGRARWGTGRTRAGDHAVPFHPVQPGLECAVGDAEDAGGKLVVLVLTVTGPADVLIEE